MTTLSKYNEIKTAYLSSLKTLSQSVATCDKYETVLNDFGNCIEQHFNTVEQSTEITPQMILKYREIIKERGVCNNTVAHYLTLLHSFFEWCKAHKFYAEQPIVKKDIPKKEEIEYDLLTEAEVYKVLSGEIPKNTRNAKRTRAIVFMFLLTGLRVSELTHLKIGDIDFVKGNITVKGKGNKKRTTALSAPAREQLTAYLAEQNKTAKLNSDSLLFCNENGQPFTRQNISQTVECYVQKLTGHTGIRAHDLRHSFASLLVTSNAPIATISSVLGHSSWKTTAIYASHLRPDKITEEVNNIFENLPIFQTA